MIDFKIVSPFINFERYIFWGFNLNSYKLHENKYLIKKNNLEIDTQTTREVIIIIRLIYNVNSRV